MPRRLKKLQITEVSSVDRAANPAARIVLMKRNLPDRYEKPRGRKNLFELQEEARVGPQEKKMKPIITVAKSVIAGNPTAHDRDDFYAALERGGRAFRKRNPALTVEQAFAKFATETDDGRTLMRALKVAPSGGGRSPMMTNTPTDKSGLQPDQQPDYRKMMKRARKLAKREGFSELEALERAYVAGKAA